ncbi:MAG: response regulator, partial [Chloroflexi bacterium]|nr:response regulator [Chloroflexota bacterium]
DVMLPKVDGWQLLTHLHERSETRMIPVIVCSVVREEPLALALGATSFLTKPLAPRQFVEALDEALVRASAESPLALQRSRETS